MATIGNLFAGVQPARVTHAAVVLGPDRNQRVPEGDQAQQIAALMQQYTGEYIASDRIQPWSWDWETGLARKDQTPMIFMVTVREDWFAIEQRNGVAVQIPHIRITGLAAYDVGLSDVYHARLWHGHPQYELRYHSNSIAVTKEDGKRIVIALYRMDRQ